MVCVAVDGVWLIAGSQDVGGFRWCFITLTSPFLIKSRPTLSLRWVTSSICICICIHVCVCVCVSAYIVYTVYLCLQNTTWYCWTTHTHTIFLCKDQQLNSCCSCVHVSDNSLAWCTEYIHIRVSDSWFIAEQICNRCPLIPFQHHVPAINHQATKLQNNNVCS